jgi:uncharacterized protein
MIALLEQHRETIANLCEQYGVERLEVFGSAARATDFEVGQSDIDFIVRFGRHPTLTPFRQYFEFEEALTALLGRKVDLVMEGAMRNPYFIRSANEHRQALYGG